MSKSKSQPPLKQPTYEAESLQDASWDIWDQKYRLKGHQGENIDETVESTWERVAGALAALEPKQQEHWKQQFLWALENGAIPAGRIVSNAGASEYKPATSTINCTVSGTIEDSMQDILYKNLEAGLTLKAGCGIGYEFSTLRPKGAYVSGAGATTSGPLSFMDIFDKMCFTISSAGGRRGAQMATFDVHHPDVGEFIRAKREAGRLRQFNLSLLITEDFIQAVKSGATWHLSFPVTRRDQEREPITLSDSQQVVWRRLDHLSGDYLRNEQGEVACKVYKKIPARQLWNQIMTSTYDFAEPGFILIDQVNEWNNNWFCEDIRATNPCGEQPLPPYGSCLLGSINLTKCVVNPFTEQAEFDWEKFRTLVAVFTRMLDNVVEVNGLALAEQRREIESKRRHGMGFLGLGSTLTMLTIPYGSPASIAFTEQVSKELALTGWREGLALAQEKGVAPIMEETFEITPTLIAKRPALAEQYQVGDQVPGKVLLARYSRYMQQIAEEDPELVDAIAEHGCRFTHHSSIAPTGTISLSLANNASNGIEPSFAHHYARNVIRSGRKSKEKVDVFSYELLHYRRLIEPNAKPYPEPGESGLPDYFVVSDQITPEQHVDVQAAAQKWIDSSISKTINVPTDIPYEKFKDIYLYAHEKGLKGCTTFRFNPEAFQGVLVKQQDLENTVYVFELEDGSRVELKGHEEVEYDGETHTAANLYEALKEGYYGKF
ncbi:adenosylcobalamin-dependent ribonucleoside-diphosphate reductase [Marinimicrobium sp. ABcell2]|uniref:adenosylcobalamin-dependent ribonucleoside-diphosphate reductase n=1 Tax=Marinimicrobium sp. ABcell2 TaxID=3069751 RepID=UPI0027AEE39F|nr:adenosylcobalamin-dependent ribonucleoside-diphosphate reductase [Marinimicrobium sp. ABcell2]MDQ2076427.1 adenosylcobalamin-dependent ribonucleoside-diphosphate reductase [Marinimicrobium sp. ABcell2]